MRGFILVQFANGRLYRIESLPSDFLIERRFLDCTLLAVGHGPVMEFGPWYS